MDTLSSLVDSGLVRPEPREDEPRFSLLRTPSGCTPWSGCARAATGRTCTTAVCRLFLSLASDAELHGAGQLAWLNQLEIPRG